MPLLEYFETLERFGLDELKQGGDLQIKNGDIAQTPDGDLQLGDTRFNALFRFVQRWRLNQTTLDELFHSMLFTTQRLEEVLNSRALGLGASLNLNPAAFHEETESIGDYESGSSVYAGAILVVLNNLLQRFRKDLNASEAQWKMAGLKISDYSLGVILSAAAANFRHHDEWARMHGPTAQQRQSIEVLSKVLGRPASINGMASIRTNVCRDVLLVVSEGSIEKLHQTTFEYVKSLSSDF